MVETYENWDDYENNYGEEENDDWNEAETNEEEFKVDTAPEEDTSECELTRDARNGEMTMGYRDVIRLLNSRVTEVVNELGLSDSLAMALLLKNSWSTEKVIDAFSSQADLV